MRASAQTSSLSLAQTEIGFDAFMETYFVYLIFIGVYVLDRFYSTSSGLPHMMVKFALSSKRRERMVIVNNEAELAALGIPRESC